MKESQTESVTLLQAISNLIGVTQMLEDFVFGSSQATESASSKLRDVDKITEARDSVIEVAERLTLIGKKLELLG